MAISLIHSTPNNWKFSARNSCSFFPIYLIMSIWTHGYLFCFMGYNSIYHYLFCFSSYSAFVIGCSFRLVSVSFWYVHFLLQALPYFLVSQDIPDSPCTSPRIKHFPEEPQVPVIKECYSGIHLDARCAHCYWILLLLGPSSEQSLGILCMCINAHTFIFLSVYEFIWHEFTLTSSSVRKF